jgi:hypothetical protein
LAGASFVGFAFLSSEREFIMQGKRESRVFIKITRFQLWKSGDFFTLG